MNENDKSELFNILTHLTEMPLLKAPTTVTRGMVSMYYAALAHRTISDIKSAINNHIRDKDRGRFYPVPADIEQQLPGINEAWPDAEEAWAMCPKNEMSSAPAFSEMIEALSIANDLLAGGDKIAARMSFKSAYNRLVEESKRAGKVPNWFATLGFDKESRYNAQVKAVELHNKLAAPENQKSLPAPPEQAITLDALMLSAPKQTGDLNKNIENLRKLKEALIKNEQGDLK